MILALLISRLDVGFVFFKWVALVFCPRRPRGLVRASSGALVWKHVIRVLPRDITEKALLSSAGVEFIVLCCYAFYPSNSTRWLV